MKGKFLFTENVRPVGQGLFCNGMIFDPKRPTIPVFTWVYDCGATGTKALSREVDRLIKSLKGRQVIDILVVSHFDTDHIKGLQQLLNEIRVENLFIPYVPRTVRILLTLGEVEAGDGVEGGDRFDYASNPVQFLQALGGNNLGRVIYVYDSGSPSDPPFDETIPPEDLKGLNTKIQVYEPNDREYPKDVLAEQDGNPHVHFMGSPACLFGYWEFVFFNRLDHQPSQPTLDAVDRVLHGARDLDGTVSDPAALIKDLKNLYEAEYKSGKERNDISLVCYTGPINESWRYRWISVAQRYTAKRYISDRPSVIDGPEVYDEHAKLSTLYLGDLNIDSKGRVDELKGFFGTTRWDRIKILLVPHHGSSESWITGAASKFGHEESIFSAGKNYKKFPGLSVRKDLEATRLVDVNEDNGCRWGGVLEVDSETTRSIQEYIIGHMDDSVQPVCDSESLESLFQFIDLQDSDFS